MSRKTRTRRLGRGGARPGAGRKPDPNAMPPENAVTVALPDDLADEVAARSTQEGISRPEVIRRILRRALGF